MAEVLLSRAQIEALIPHRDPFLLLDRVVFEDRSTQRLVAELASLPRLLLVCGHYEGIDERVRLGSIDREISIGDFAGKYLLERYTPPAAIVNDKGDILYLQGRTGKYLEPAPGKALFNQVFNGDIRSAGIRGLTFQCFKGRGKTLYVLVDQGHELNHGRRYLLSCYYFRL